LQHTTTLLVTTGAGAFVCNLPDASTVVGKRVTIIKIDSGAGAIQIAPNGADVIANAGNVSIYIGQQFRHATLQAQAAGQWIVGGGEWQPSQAVDSNGSQLSLGRFHHFPLGNVIDRRAYSGAFPAVGSWTAAINIAGLYGVPIGAKCVRCKVTLASTLSAIGLITVTFGFSDNNANAPSLYTSHPVIHLSVNQVNPAATLGITEEIEIPINAIGEIYAYTIGATNINVATSVLTIAVTGYYMGD
jgi:hypothetical protein